MMGISDRTRIYHVTYAGPQHICFLFFWGCNFKCRICLLKKEAFDCHLAENRLRIYEPSSLGAPPDRFITLSELRELLDPVALNQTFLMGAEPLCNPLLFRVLQYLKGERKCAVTLLTNGYLSPPLSVLDEVVFSFKAVTPGLHFDYTGREVGPVLRSFRRIARARQARLYAETVFIPGYVDAKEIEKIAEFIASVDTQIPFRIDAYIPIPGQPWESPAVADIAALGERINTILPHATYFHGEGGKKELAYPVARLY